MPELPEIESLCHAIDAKARGKTLQHLEFHSPFVLRSVTPNATEIFEKKLVGVQRIAKRVVLRFEAQYSAVIHLMLSGKFVWLEKDKKVSRNDLATWDFGVGRLRLSEPSKKKRASVHLVQGDDAMMSFHPGGLDVLDMDFNRFRALTKEKNHTLKRFLSDQRLLAGIGNGESDEILHAAKLSPLMWSTKLDDTQALTLFEAIQKLLCEHRDELVLRAKTKWPRAHCGHDLFRVHGCFGNPCPRCKTPIQRIQYKSRETNYCPECQTDGKLLADRSLSRLLGKDWPKTLEELEADNERRRRLSEG